MLTIRAARVEDAAALAAAEREVARTPGLLISKPHELKDEAFAQRIAALGPEGAYVVAEEDGALAGHALLDPMPLEAVAHARRLTIVVHEGFQGRGIGRAMLTHLLMWVDATPSVGKVELNVRATNSRAISLYRKLGFREEGRYVRRVRLPDGTYVDDVSMAWFPARRR